MPKLMCRCGEVLNLSLIPVPGQQILIREADWDQLVDALAAAAERVGTADPALLREALSDAFAGFGDEVYRCPRSGHLIVVDRDTGAAQFFAPDPRPE